MDIPERLGTLYRLRRLDLSSNSDPATGRIRAILRDWTRALPSALGDTAGLEVVTTRGIVEAVRRVR